MCPHDVDHRIGPKLPEVVGADNGILQWSKVGARLVLEQGIEVGAAFDGPLHVRHKSDAGKALVDAPSPNIGDQVDCSILIEESILQVHLAPLEQLELSALLRRQWVKSGGCEPRDMVGAALRIEDVDGLFTSFEAFPDERRQSPIVVLVAAEESTHVATGPEDRAGKVNRSSVVRPLGFLRLRHCQTVPVFPCDGPESIRRTYRTR